MEKEELEILEYVFQLATGECYSCEIAEIGKLEEKIGTILYQYKKQKEIIDKAIEYIKKAQLGELPDGVIYWLKYDAVGKKLLQILEDKEV